MISVCMATYNGARFIKEQVDSILLQLSPCDELVISDDSSTDNTVSIIERYNDPRIKLLKRCAKPDPVSNFENALKAATKEIIFLADQDDIWEESKVEILTAALDNSILVTSDCMIIDENGNVLIKSFFKTMGAGKGLVKNFFKNSYMGCCMAFKRDLLKKALPFPSGIPMHDQWLGLCAELNGKVRFEQRALVRYRKHDKNASPTAGGSTFSILQKLQLRIRFVRAFAMRHLIGR